MTSTRLKVLGVLALAVPFGFGVLRFRATGTDLRYLAVAVASTVGALVALGRVPTMARVAAGAVAAALCAAGVSFLVGSRNAVSVAVVSLSFAACSAAGAWLLATSGRLDHPSAPR